MGYSAQKRGAYLAYTSEQKWQRRQRGEMYRPWEDFELVDDGLFPNLCKNQPKVMIKYINMQTTLCPTCLRYDQLKARCSVDHLQKSHNIQIESVRTIIQKVKQLTKSQESKKNGQPKMNRNEILKYAEGLIQPNLDKLKGFLSLRGH